MGDTGSLALGGALAGLAILSRTELLAVILGGLFVLITLSVVIQVGFFKLTGKRVFRMAPLQHHFELSGWDEVTIVIRFWIIAGLFVAGRPRDLLRGVGGRASGRSSTCPGRRVLVGRSGRVGPRPPPRRCTVSVRACVTLDDDGAADADTARTPTAVDPGGPTCVVTSPGLAPHHPLLAGRGRPAASRSGARSSWPGGCAPASRAAGAPAPWLAVTGTNGKTTTVNMLAVDPRPRASGRPAVGNVGTPIVDAVHRPEPSTCSRSSCPASSCTSRTRGRRRRRPCSTSRRTTSTGTAGSRRTRAAKGRSTQGIERRLRLQRRRPAPRAAGACRRRRRGRPGGRLHPRRPGPGQLGVVDDVLVDRAFHEQLGRPRPDTGARPSWPPSPTWRTSPARAAASRRTTSPTRWPPPRWPAPTAWPPRPRSRDGLRAFLARRAPDRRAVAGTVRRWCHFVDDSKATNAHAAAASLAGFAPGTGRLDRRRPGQGRRFDDLVRGTPTGCAASVLIGADRAAAGGGARPTRARSPGGRGSTGRHWDGDDTAP